MHDISISTQRLNFRKITEDDYDLLCTILQDAEVMYAWEHSFSDEEIKEWIGKNLSRYRDDGFSYLAVFDKNNGNFIGLIGLLTENIDGRKYIGIAYILSKKHWGCGYASEGASGCLDYAFDRLNSDKVIAEIRPMNRASIKVAERIGMKIEGSFDKVYKGKKMTHLIYSITKSEYLSLYKERELNVRE